MRQSRVLGVLCSVAIVSLAGCGEKTPDSANGSARPDATGAQSEIQQSLQAWYAAHPQCVVFPSGKGAALPANVPDPDREKIAAAERVGLVEVGPAKGNGQAPGYSVTPAGEKAIRSDSRAFFTTGKGLCYAARQITSITEQTAMPDLAGVKVLKVTYGYKLQGVAAWANDPAILAAFPKIAQAMKSPVGSDTEILVKPPGETWRPEKAG